MPGSYPSKNGLSIISPDGKAGRTLTGRRLTTYVFSKRGDVIGVYQESTAEGAEWRMISIDVKTGVEMKLGTISLPGTMSSIYGFSLHPDGKRFAVSISRSHYDIFLLEGFDELSRGSITCCDVDKRPLWYSSRTAHAFSKG